MLHNQKPMELRVNTGVKNQGEEDSRDKKVRRKGDLSGFDKRGPKVKSKHNRIYERLSEWR